MLRPATGTGSPSNQPPIRFGHGGDEVIPRVSQTIGSIKAMITISFAGTGLVKLVYIYLRGGNVIGGISSMICLNGSTDNAITAAGCQITKMMKIPVDDSRVRNALHPAETIRKMKVERLAHPAYSHDCSRRYLSLLDGPRQRWEIGDLLIRIMLSRR
jgi:hypothetical protein